MGTNIDSRRTAPPPGIPSEGVRAVATVAISLVLVGLVLAIAANSLSGSSALLAAIKSRLFAPWLAPAWLDLGFDQRLTYGLPDDADHELEIARRDASDAEPLFFPGSRRGEQAARWRRLARAIAIGEAEDDGSVVAAGVGRGGFDDLGVEDVVVRVLRQPLRERTGPADIGTAEQVYDARVRLVGDDLQLIKDEAKSELAPLVKPPAPRDAAAPP
ncbi:MAG: hypothetical protein K8S94_14160 [Planctomycetia bacterium]|nr:hypothetical protein [Planctomycetia bacterium]